MPNKHTTIKSIHDNQKIELNGDDDLRISAQFNRNEAPASTGKKLWDGGRAQITVDAGFGDNSLIIDNQFEVAAYADIKNASNLLTLKDKSTGKEVRVSFQGIESIVVQGKEYSMIDLKNNLRGQHTNLPMSQEKMNEIQNARRNRHQ